MKMPQPSDYRKRAEECVQLAQTVRTPEQRTMLLHIAETWLRLARDANLKGARGGRSVAIRELKLGAASKPLKTNSRPAPAG